MCLARRSPPIARRRLLGALASIVVALVPAAAFALCAPVAEGPRAWPAAVVPEPPAKGSVELTFLGHATFLLRTAEGVTAVMDYTDYVPAPLVPDIATMNIAHPTHYSLSPDPGIKHVLRGWKDGGVAEIRFAYKDLAIFNVPTNIREWETGGTRYAGNSIFVFESAGLCIAHLSHLHHTLTPEHLKQLGQIDVLLVPVDGLYTMPQSRAVEVVDQIKPRVVVPMHVFTPVAVEQFIAIIGKRYPVKQNETATAVFSRATLPDRQLLVLPAPYR
ncbi:MAG: MBL fold metallo-hydrolase [Rhodospirillaceae bacterium]|nr:MBL fold metallo-hydrolase [Rhodospirillaceae bacterium]